MKYILSPRFYALLLLIAFFAATPVHALMGGGKFEKELEKETGAVTTSYPPS